MMREVYVFDYFTVIKSDSLNVDVHSHVAHQISISLDDCPLKFTTVEGEFEDYIVFLPSLKKHKFLSKTCENLTILIDDESSFHADLSSVDLSKFRLDQINESEIKRILLELGLLSDSKLDARIEEVIRIIQNEDNLESIKLVSMAKEVGLSQGRLIHLFKEEVGITFRKYIQWQKLKRAISLASNDLSITDLAVHAGFSDSSHFSKFFKSTFGISPKDIFNNSQFIQVSNS